MSTNIIKINRGDSFEFTVYIPNKNNPTIPYNLRAIDALYFALLYPHQKFEDALILKGYSGTDTEVDHSTGKVTIKFTHNETKKLTPGVYYYTAKLHIGGSLEDLGVSKAPDEVRTIIERTKFIVNE